MDQGAALSLPIKAKKEDTIFRAKFGKWLINHIDRWFAWVRQLELGVDRMEDIILVTGTHRTRSFANVAFPGGQKDAQVSFRAKVDCSGDNGVDVNWQFSHERNRGAFLKCGPDGEVSRTQLCWSMIFYLSRALIGPRTYQRASAYSYEGFESLVNS